MRPTNIRATCGTLVLSFHDTRWKVAFAEGWDSFDFKRVVSTSRATSNCARATRDLQPNRFRHTVPPSGRLPD
jgi:hypothetical protein